MEKKEFAAKWFEKVDYDVSAAKSMLASGHFLYVAFLCQQATEKILKALWSSLREDLPPYTHNLGTLAESLGLSLTESQKGLLDLLGRYYIVGRYPSFKQKLAMALNKEKAGDLLKQTEDFIQWCRQSTKM